MAKELKVICGDDLGHKIVRILRKKNIRQKSFAKTLFISESNLSSYTTGRSLPPCTTLANIAYRLGTSTDYLLGLTDDDGLDIGREKKNALKRQIDDLSKEVERLSWKVEQIRAMIE